MLKKYIFTILTLTIIASALNAQTKWKIDKAVFKFPSNFSDWIVRNVGNFNPSNVTFGSVIRSNQSKQLVDFNKDGKLDICIELGLEDFLGSKKDSAYRYYKGIFLNQGNGTYLLDTNFILTGRGSPWYGKFGDFNGDGKLDYFHLNQNYHGSQAKKPLDLFKVQSDASPSHVFFNNGKTFDRIDIDTVDMISTNGTVADINGDGLDEIISMPSEKFIVYQFEPISKTFIKRFNNINTYIQSKYGRTIKWFHFDKVIDNKITITVSYNSFSSNKSDWRIELLEVNLADSSTKVLQGFQHPMYKWPNGELSTATLHANESFKYEDLNYDGNKELIMISPFNYGDERMGFNILQDNILSTSSYWKYDSTEVGFRIQGYIKDLDGDGFSEIIPGESFSNYYYKYVNGRYLRQNYEAASGSVLPDYKSKTYWTWSDDFNGDGLNDVLYFDNNNVNDNYLYTTINEPDADKDGISDKSDNCPFIYNPSQADIDNDKIGDACDDVIKYATDPILFYDSLKTKIYLIKNPTAKYDSSTYRTTNGLVEFGAPFERDIIPIDFDNDGKLDIINGSAYIEDEQKNKIDLGHVTVPVYFKNKGDFKFDVYYNNNYIDNSILHAIQNFDLVDVDGDGKKEIYLGGEHYHLPFSDTENPKNILTRNWLSNYANHKNRRDYTDFEFKSNRYYSIENGLLKDKVDKIIFQGVTKRNAFSSIHSIVSFDFDNDGDIDLVNMAQTERGYVFNIMANQGKGDFILKQQQTNYFIPEGRMIGVDVDKDGFKDIVCIGAKMDMNTNAKEEGNNLMYFKNNANSFDFNSPILIKNVYTSNSAITGWKNDKSLRSFIQTDIDKDGNDELILYVTNLYSGLGSIDRDSSKLQQLVPHNLVLIFTLKNNTLVEVTKEFLPDYNNLDKWFANHSAMHFVDLDKDGIVELMPYSSNLFPNYKWNYSDSYQYFKFNKVSKKYEYISHDWLSKMLPNNSKFAEVRMNILPNMVDYEDMDGDGIPEIIQASINLDLNNDKIYENYMAIVKSDILSDSDLDGIINPLDNCPNFQNPVSPVIRDTSFCINALADTLKVSPLNGNKLLWYGQNASGGNASALPPKISTSSIGTLTYYVSQANNINGCESNRVKINVIVNPLPSTPIIKDLSYCQFQSADTLKAISSVGNTLLWYGTSETGGANSLIASVPSTNTVGTQSYYVSQKINSTGCEGARAKILINIKPNPIAPVLSRDTANYLVSTTSNTTWYKDATALTDTAQRIKPTSTGVYSAKTTLNGCMSVASTSYYYLLTDIINLTNGEFIKLAPNPFQGNLTLDFIIKGYQSLNVEIYELASGNKIGQRNNVYPGTKIQFDNLNPGTHIIRVVSTDNKVNYHFKMVKL